MPTPTKEYLYASDQTGNAALMHVTAVRSVASTVLKVDTLVGVPQKFIATSGTPNAQGFIDPATATDFFGHINGLDLAIDGFCPGAIDVGNVQGQIVVIRPNTTWANMVAAQLNAVQINASENLLPNGNFISASNGYGGLPAYFTNSTANPVQGGFPSITKANLISLLGVVDGDIEGLWSLNGTWNDLSSNGYNLTPNNGPTDVSDGLMAQAKNFARASSQYATNASVPNMLVTGSQTWACYFKANTLNSMTIMGHGESSGSTVGHLFMDVNNNIGIRLSGLTGATAYVNPTVRIETGKWYFIVGTYDSVAQKLSIWINGVKASVTASGTHTVSGTQTFSVGRVGAYAGDYFDGVVQGAMMLSVALTDDQIRRLWAYTTYSGVKLRRAASDGYIYQSLPSDLVERLRGTTLTLRGVFSQDTSSIAQIALYDGTESASAVSTDTVADVAVSVTKDISATATQITVRLKVSSFNGSAWFKELALFQGSVALPYKHSYFDLINFPLLLQQCPPWESTGYKFETKNLLGRATRSSSFSTGGSGVLVSEMTIQVYVPAGTHKVRIKGYGPLIYTNVALAYAVMQIWDGAVGSGTDIQEWKVRCPADSVGSGAAPEITMDVTGPIYKSYNLGLVQGGSSGTVDAAVYNPMYIEANLV